MKENILDDLKQNRAEKGGLETEDFRSIGRNHGRPISDVYSVATFYTETSPQKRGKYRINICKSTPCRMKDHDSVLQLLKEELNIGPGEVTKDGRFSIHLVNCIGACDSAPSILINENPYGNLDTKKIRNILNALT
jgi:NADH-quinone oxidoreductase subunit E